MTILIVILLFLPKHLFRDSTLSRSPDAAPGQWAPAVAQEGSCEFARGASVAHMTAERSRAPVTHESGFRAACARTRESKPSVMNAKPHPDSACCAGRFNS